MQHGLDYTHGGGWSAEDQPEGNYLWGDEHSAHDYAAMKYFDYDMPYDVWKVRHEGLPLVGDPYLGSDPEDAAMTTQPVTPDRLQVMDPSEWGYESYWPADRNGPGMVVPSTRPRTAAGKGNHPKDMIEAPVPFVYDIPTDKLHIGYEGTTTHDVPGKISPGGIVEGYYEPGGKITMESYSTHPWSVRHLLDLWYHHAPQMEITSVEQTERDGSTTKLATEEGMHVGRYIQTLLQGDQAANTAYKALRDAGGKVYAVGGAPRDALQGRVPNDIDLMVSGLPAVDVEHILNKLPGHMVYAGKNFGVYHYYHPNGDHVEIALPRSDDYSGGSRAKAKITTDPNLSVEDDLKRRDFTANASAVDLDTGEFIDPHGAADDIKRGALRTTHPNAFWEDPTRLIRALTMHSRFGLKPDEQTRHEMEANGHMLNGESADALNKSFTKLFESDNPAAGIRLAKDTGLLQHLLPELHEHWDYDQKNPHHKYSLGEHSLQVLDNVSRLTNDPDVRLAALLHDIGKPISAWTDNEGVNHYYEKTDDLRIPWHTDENGKSQYDVAPSAKGSWGANHETKGAELADERLRETFNLSRDRLNRIKYLIQHHMFAPFTTPKGARRFMYKVGDENVDDLLNLREADQTGKGQTPEEVAARTSADQMRQLVEQQRVKGDTTGINAISVNGNDLLNMGLKQGPEVGKVLTQLQNDVVDDPSLNDRQTLLNLAQQYVRASPSYSPNPG
jgi:tRNA nucleotidyltransferase (CCA-adding enzyme)